MFGDVGKADVIMSFMPGTNTTMESFYTSTQNTGLTALTRLMVDDPPAGVDVAGFVLKQGFFPNLAPPEVAVLGPQVNLWALRGWEAQDGTAYYAIQGPTDINRALDGVQVDPFGYAVTASEENGFTELDSGFTGFDPFGQHGDVISADPEVNGDVHVHLHRIIAEAARR